MVVGARRVAKEKGGERRILPPIEAAKEASP